MQVGKDINLSPIYGLWHKPFWQTKTFYVILGAVLLLLIFFTILFLIKKYVRKRVEKTAWQIALFDINALKELLLQNKVNSQDFYLSLTEIIKSYLFARYGYDLFGKTDLQMIQVLQKKQFDKELLESIEDMLQSIQIVKFAKASAAKEVMEQDIAKSIVVINKTIPMSNKAVKVSSKE